jgi:hypothetical protein
MSRQNNVNPDHYKVAGRERTGNTGNAAAKNSRQPQAVNRDVERMRDRTRKGPTKGRS